MNHFLLLLSIERQVLQKTVSFLKTRFWRFSNDATLGFITIFFLYWCKNFWHELLKLKVATRIIDSERNLN